VEYIVANYGDMFVCVIEGEGLLFKN